MSLELTGPAANLPWDCLPHHLRERLQICEPGQVRREPPPVAGDLPPFVLYWMRSAVRSDENPALAVAQLMAVEMDLPLLVYQGLSDDYPYASDRHHQFMLEGARDVQSQLAQRAISYVFHLTTNQDQTPWLLSLAAAATVMVTEDMPVDPPRHFLNVLRSRVKTPMAVVDTSCVVPMRLVPRTVTGQPQTRAYQFRAVTQRERKQRLLAPWPGVDRAARRFPVERLPFAHLDLSEVSLDALIASCAIDHTIPPARHTRGGTTAGYERWDRFRSQGLKSYDKRRNDPLQATAVSRLSPYLHYGMISPFRVAREAAAQLSGGAEKFLDELLIWRELAYHFCFHRPDHDQWSALPEWARQTLQLHATDRRLGDYDWEQLSRGRTDDALWNVAQRSLLLHGELHNNVRMTWGKALLSWTRSPELALRLLIDLNNRYALDGRDPSSYGGILWCFGQFDRRFEPEQPIVGTVRPRLTRDHALRLSVEKYRAQIENGWPVERPRVAVIGAGLAGLIAARTLVDHGCSVQCYEKSRGVGGRMSTRRTDDGASFDHGAQYFTVRSPQFRSHVESWRQRGLVAVWPQDEPLVVIRNQCIERVSDSVQRYVASPGMTAICRELARDVTVHLNELISRIDVGPSQVELWGPDGASRGVFDKLVVALPAPQAADLLIDLPELHDPLKSVPMQPCWATMAIFPDPSIAMWPGAFLHHDVLSWAAWNHTKPGRQHAVATLVMHATPGWTTDAWERESAWVGRQMLHAFQEATGLRLPEPLSLHSHRWRYALPLADHAAGSKSEFQYLSNSTGNVVVCGDWCVGGRVEGAFLSGSAAAGHILRGRRPSARSSEQPVQLRLF